VTSFGRARRVLAAITGAAVCVAGGGIGLSAAERAPALAARRFTLAEPAEVIAVVTAACAACDWGRKGREAAVLALRVDGRYSQDLPLTRGPGSAAYRVLLGSLDAGTHELEVHLDPVSAPGVGAVTADVSFEPVPASSSEHLALALAPILHQRANAVGRFTDVPLLMYYEVSPLPAGQRIDYSVVFTHEDGGTPADRLMATWGRVTDIELAYSVELDAAGAIVKEIYQGKDHEMPAFAGQREGRHPLLWVVTDNNMFGERGPTSRRHRPAPRRVDLAGPARGAGGGAEPWTYRVMSEEVRREGRIVERPARGSKKIPDSRRFAFLEACTELHDARLAFDVGVAGTRGVEWFASDAADSRFRVARSGCFRAAVALPPNTPDSAIRAIRLRASTRPPGKGEARLPPGTGWARLTRVNRLFRLGADFAPGADLLRWTGDARLAGEAAGFELPAGR
jgi:hypothetical protein